jgi:hypothetical protein
MQTVQHAWQIAGVGFDLYIEARLRLMHDMAMVQPFG